jgi:7,8-dihydropterin-6-yl-methyl-4-(beta-D-ribofuranosyl)aminobenzene 5'-phosphate synthase
MMEKLKIYALVDNAPSSTCNAEHGLSYVIEFDEKILFDTGQSDLFIENAVKLGVSLDEIPIVALSHGHYDHGNGLQHLNGKTLICHPDVFLTRYSGKQRKYVGLEMTRKALHNQFRVNETKAPFWFSDKMVFLGEIPRKITFEKSTQAFFIDNNQTDALADDTGLAIIMNQGLFVISGCAHSGICNIIEHARKVTGVDKVYGVMGGFHLKQNNKQTQETIAWLQALNVQVVLPSHCTALPALAAFYNVFGGEQIKAGTLYTFDEQ